MLCQYHTKRYTNQIHDCSDHCCNKYCPCCFHRKIILGAHNDHKIHYNLHQKSCDAFLIIAVNNTLFLHNISSRPRLPECILRWTADYNFQTTKQPKQTKILFYISSFYFFLLISSNPLNEGELADNTTSGIFNVTEPVAAHSVPRWKTI